MGLGDWASNARWYYQNLNLGTAAKVSAAELLGGAVRRAYSHAPRLGRPIYERDWDALIILDTCRPDALEAVASEYDFLPNGRVPTATSLGSNSREFMRYNFTEEYREEMDQTAFVTFNPNSDAMLDPNDWLLLDEVWRDAWEADIGSVRPRTVTNRSIAAHRELDPERTIIQYQQPHTPYPHFEKHDCGALAIEDDANDRSGIFGAILDGKITREEAWEGYLDNLRWALDDLELLLSNLDAERVILTSDHGECFGEWGLYGHHRSTPVPELIRVPWVVTEATDEGTHEPPAASTDPDDVGLDSKLSSLGYL
ncbi:MULTISPECIES: alkaline phosphatase family protein [Haloferax]|uniref:Sulfatase N-terminal domain-containing protein n=1 Tax=Haloferax gibbonsii TaxID=35746 RepID=A0A0K1IT25_HALGI|nr:MULTISPECIES: hypothetical protein [Haloferax]AKU07579.1 hypothetical protein ABY42_07415 [Haloferax gibbonsii]